MRIVLVHDWLTGMRGGEKVLEVLCELEPGADILTLLHRRGMVSATIERHRIRTSFIQRLPFAATQYRRYLPLFPFAIEQFDVDPYDLVISSSHCAAKAVIPTGRARHICYCHSPMRYAWDQFDAYFGPERVGRLPSRLFYRPTMAWLARWDAATAARVDRFVANSHHVAARISRYYNRMASVVFPPVDTVFYHPAGAAPAEHRAGVPDMERHRDVLVNAGPRQRGGPVGPEAHFLIVSALVPYKRIDLAIAACRRVGARLRIVGEGPERDALERQADGTVEFLGALTDEQIREEYRRALAVILPGEEDFGIVPVEAQACGRPAVALGRGGALDTVVDGETGVLFPAPTVDSLAAALERVAAMRFDPARLRAHAEGFSRERFAAAMRALIDETAAAPAGTRW